MSPMILHRIANGPLGPIEAAMMEYVWAGNGVFVRARRKGMAATIPVAYLQTRGLEEIEPAAAMEYPKVPERFLATMLKIAKEEKDERGEPREIVFRMAWDEEAVKWTLDIPEQEQTDVFCKPLSKEPENTIIEIHSHHEMSAVFSEQDDRDEKGFRLYAVMGEFEKQPLIHMRLGIHGHYADVPASQFMEIPDGLEDWLDQDVEEEEVRWEREG